MFIQMRRALVQAFSSVESPFFFAARSHPHICGETLCYSTENSFEWKGRTMTQPIFPLPWGNRNDNIRCIVCKTHLARHVGNYQQVRIYRCTNPECHSLIGETGNGVPTRSLLVDSDVLRASID